MKQTEYLHEPCPKCQKCKLIYHKDYTNEYDIYKCANCKEKCYHSKQNISRNGYTGIDIYYDKDNIPQMLVKDEQKKLQ